MNPQQKRAASVEKRKLTNGDEEVKQQLLPLLLVDRCRDGPFHRGNLTQTHPNQIFSVYNCCCKKPSSITSLRFICGYYVCFFISCIGYSSWKIANNLLKWYLYFNMLPKLLISLSFPLKLSIFATLFLLFCVVFQLHQIIIEFMLVQNKLTF